MPFALYMVNVGNSTGKSGQSDHSTNTRDAVADRFNVSDRTIQREYTKLRDSILNEGCRDSLVLWNNILIDGHNRYQICTEHSIEYNTVSREFENREAVKLWMIDNQLARRNLTREQMKDLRGQYYATHKQAIGTNQHNIDRGGHFDHPLKTRGAVADKFNVSDRTIQRDYTYTQNLDTIASVAGYDTRKAITSRKLHATECL